MLPQPNFGPASEPDRDDEEEAGPPKQIRRLRIALWVEAVFAVIAGNLLVVSVFASRAFSLDDLTEQYAKTESAKDAASLAKDTYEYYQSSGFMVWNLSMAGVTLLAAIVTALCAMRLKTQLKAVRWTAAITSILLFLAGMLMTVAFGYLVAPWIFAAVLALWWLFSSDVRYWMSESAKAA